MPLSMSRKVKVYFSMNDMIANVSWYINQVTTDCMKMMGL